MSSNTFYVDPRLCPFGLQVEPRFIERKMYPLGVVCLVRATSSMRMAKYAVNPSLRSATATVAVLAVSFTLQADVVVHVLQVKLQVLALCPVLSDFGCEGAGRLRAIRRRFDGCCRKSVLTGVAGKEFPFMPDILARWNTPCMTTVLLERGVDVYCVGKLSQCGRREEENFWKRSSRIPRRAALVVSERSFAVSSSGASGARLNVTSREFLVFSHQLWSDPAPTRSCRLPVGVMVSVEGEPPTVAAAAATAT